MFYFNKKIVGKHRGQFILNEEALLKKKILFLK